MLSFPKLISIMVFILATGTQVEKESSWKVFTVSVWAAVSCGTDHILNRVFGNEDADFLELHES